MGLFGYGLGHAAMAVVIGLMGRSLVGGGADPGRGWPLLTVCYVGLAAAIVKAGSVIPLAYADRRLVGRVAAAVRRDVVSGLLKAGTHDAAPRVHARIAVRIREIEAAAASGALGGARALAQLVPLALALIALSLPLALAATVGVVPFAWLLAAIRRRWRASNARAQFLAEQLQSGVDELVRNLDLWRAYSAGSSIGRAIESGASRAVAAEARAEAGRAALSAGNEVLAALALVTALLIANRLGLGLGDGSIVAFAAVVFMAYRPLRELGDARTALTRGAVAFESMERLMESTQPLIASERVERVASEHASTRSAARVVGSHALAPLDVDEVGSALRGPRTSFRVEPGEIVCVVGPTGSGKTTLLRALLGLEPAAGRIHYGGSDITTSPVGSVARPFAWVPQDAPLVTGSLVDNVTLFGGDEQSARAALSTIGANALLDRIGDAQVGPGARPLSGGERRQVALARALATELPVLLLDEPSEGLDAAAERDVLTALRSLRGRRSMIVVTHRSDVAEIADRIVHIGTSTNVALSVETERRAVA